MRANCASSRTHVQDKWFWRYNAAGQLSEAPSLINNFWHGFNKDMHRIDAVYERVYDDTIVFFVGANYYEFAANAAKPGYPR